MDYQVIGYEVVTKLGAWYQLIHDKGGGGNCWGLLRNTHSNLVMEWYKTEQEAIEAIILEAGYPLDWRAAWWERGRVLVQVKRNASGGFSWFTYVRKGYKVQPSKFGKAQSYEQARYAALSAADALFEEESSGSVASCKA